MENDMRSIGEMARDSGLGVSALRFYDRAGVLVPAWVDPVSGYRWYGPEQLEEARVLVRLRRAGMPLADIRLVLAAWPGADTDLVGKLLTAHLRRLEAGLSEARGEFSALRDLLAHRENPMTSFRSATALLPGSELIAAIDAVRYAVGTDPELPVLGGVLFDLEDGALHVVATDRYRLAVARAAVSEHGSEVAQVVVPAPLVDGMRAVLSGGEPVRFSVDGGRVTVEAGDRRMTGDCLDHDFPDYRRLVQLPAGRRALVDVPAFDDAVRNGPVRTQDPSEGDGAACDVSVLEVTDDGTVTVRGDGEDGGGADRGADGDAGDGPRRVAVNRRFLLDALAAGARDRLILEFGAPTAPITIRRPDDEATFSLLMPVSLEG
ncbi:MerR family transcriptional regulator [Streptomyces sp. NPDC002328]|uniref:DNA polymerase III subunit beta family protein n=1 Tax=Streptomyces sp. NPDC002328 TaxID=3364642 RepID=UPI003674E277